MGKRSKLIASLAVLILLTGVAWTMLRSREPVYGGKPVSYWLKQKGFMPIEATFGRNNAMGIRAEQSITMDAKAVPFLIEALNRKEGAVRKSYLSTRRRLPRFLQKMLPTPVPVPLLQLNAIAALANLGTDASPAIPSLAQKLKESDDPMMRILSAIALSKIARNDRQVKEALMAATHDTNSAVRTQAQLLLNMGGYDYQALPAEAF